QSLNCNTSGFSCDEIMGGVPRTESRCAGINNQEIQEQAWSGWRCTEAGTCQKVPANPPGWITEDICSSGTQCTTNPPPAHCVAVDGDPPPGGGGSDDGDEPPPPSGSA